MKIILVCVFGRSRPRLPIGLDFLPEFLVLFSCHTRRFDHLHRPKLSIFLWCPQSELNQCVRALQTIDVTNVHRSETNKQNRVSKYFDSLYFLIDQDHKPLISSLLCIQVETPRMFQQLLQYL